MALGGVTQAIKQPADQVSNAVINIGGMNLAKGISSAVDSWNDVPDAMPLLEMASIGERGRLIAGTKWDSELQTEINRLGGAIKHGNRIRVAARYQKATEVWMKMLTTSDVRSASTAWIMFYKKYLEDNGLKLHSWQEEADMVRDGSKERRNAMAYAETMTDITQASSDPSNMAKFAQRGRTGADNFMRLLFNPFSSFSVQMRARIINDISDIGFYGKMAGGAETQEQKIQAKDRQAAAMRSLTATVGANAMYSVAKFAIAKTLVTGLATGLLALLGGDDDDTEDTALAVGAMIFDVLHTLRLMDADVNRAWQEAVKLEKQRNANWTLEQSLTAEGEKRVRQATTEFIVTLVGSGWPTGALSENAAGYLLFQADYWTMRAAQDPRVMKKDGTPMEFNAWARMGDRGRFYRYGVTDPFIDWGMIGIVTGKSESLMRSVEKAIDGVGVHSKKPPSQSSSSGGSSPKSGSSVKRGGGGIKSGVSR